MAIPTSTPNGNLVTVPAKPPSIESASLPSATSSDLVLVPASPTEYAQCSRLNAEEWRGPLTLEEYMEREKYLLAQELTRDGGATGWFLTSRTLPKNPDGTRPILASCETNLAAAYVARNGALDKITSHGICSVFTRPEHRGRGYAGRMMTELSHKLATWQQPNGTEGLFSVLYSDIGTKFYSRYGWKSFPSTHIHLTPLRQSTYDATRQGLPEVQDLTVHDLKELPAAKIVEQELILESQQQPNIPFVAFKPDLAHFGWHHAREDFVCSKLGLQHPSVKGAIHRPTGIAIVWAKVFASKHANWQLHLLHTIVPLEVNGSTEGIEALSALLLRAQSEAGSWNMEGGVEIWDPTDMMIASAQRLITDVHDKIEVIHRDQEHVCSLRWIGKGNDVDEVVWKYNQKYAWC